MKRIDKKLLKFNVEQVAEYDFSQNKVFGSAYCVIQDGETVYQRCFGNVSLGDAEAVTEHTLFRLASMTKPITAMAALILLDRGMLSLWDPVSKYLPEFAELHVTKLDETGHLVDLGRATKDVSICNLLTHTSGIGSDPLKSGHMTAEDKRTVDGTVAFYRKMGLDFEPGEDHKYSATGAFDVLVKIIEQISGIDYQTFLRREIFEPCGMVDTTFVPTAEQWSRMIDMHHRIDGGNAIGRTTESCVFADYPCTHYLGGAGLASTLHDYSRFAAMLLNGGRTATGRLVSEDTFKLLHTPVFPKAGNERWGLSVRVVVNEAYKRLPVGAYGWSGAYGAHFWIDPTNRIAAVFMKNSLCDGGAGNQSARHFESAVTATLDGAELSL